jgi:3-dehydroquinate synthase
LQYYLKRKGVIVAIIHHQYLQSVSASLSKITSSHSQVIWVTDTNTFQHCWPLLHNTNSTALVITLPAGEENKNWSTCEKLFSFLIENKADRKSALIALGGGMITDLVGFCASVYKRGIAAYYYPTSLLGMVDASVGGKTGIDFRGLKNIIGTFQEPKEVHIFPDFLNTLPQQEVLSGLAEMMKHQLIAPTSDSFWEILKLGKIEVNDLKPFIANTIAFKESVVEEDPEEEDYRKVLNTGHTVGHAIESWFLEQEKPIPHGYALAVGIFCEAYIGWRVGYGKPEFVKELKVIMETIYPKLTIPETAFETICNLALNDKKNSNTEIKAILPADYGVFIWDQVITKVHIEEALTIYNKHFNSH